MGESYEAVRGRANQFGRVTAPGRRLDLGAMPSPTPRARTYAEVEAALLARWPETRLEPSLDRIQALVELLGDPQRAYQVVHLTGTNGKTAPRG